MAEIDNQPNQISNFKLKFSYWYISHKLQLKKVLAGFLIVISVGLFSYSIYSASLTLFVYDQEYRDMISAMSMPLIDYQYFHQKNKPFSLQLGSFEVISANDGRYDFLVKINNFNDKWIAESAVIQLFDGSRLVATKSTFIYPGQDKFVIFFGKTDVSPSTALVKISDVKWRRYLEFDNFASARLNFEVSDIKFNSAGKLNTPGVLPVSNLSFKIKNNTAYSYWQVGVYMILMTGNGIGGANYFAIDQFRAGEERKVEMNWYEPLPPIYEVKIIPEVDIFDAGSYMPAE